MKHESYPMKEVRNTAIDAYFMEIIQETSAGALVKKHLHLSIFHLVYLGWVKKASPLLCVDFCSAKNNE